MSGRGHFEFVGIKRFFRLEEMSQKTNANKKKLVELALLSEALYKIGSIVLINKAKMDAFCQKMRVNNLDSKTVFMEPQEASEHLGLSLELFYQLASRAEALYQINGKFIVNVNLLNKYFDGYKVRNKNDFDDIYQILGLMEEKENV